jgi:hypothetical protein
MPPRGGRGPPAPEARNDPPIDEQPAKVLDGEFNNQPLLQSQDEAAPPSAVDLADAPPISPIALAAGREVLFGATMDLADWAASHARSAAEAAYRGDASSLGDHLKAARNALEGALLTFAELERETVKAADAELAPA